MADWQGPPFKGEYFSGTDQQERSTSKAVGGPQKVKAAAMVTSANSNRPQRPFTRALRMGTVKRRRASGG